MESFQDIGTVSPETGSDSPVAEETAAKSKSETSEESKTSVEDRISKNVDKRIGKIIAQRNEARGESEALKKEIEDLKGQISGLGKKTLSNEDIKLAMKQAADEGKYDLVSEGVDRLVENRLKEYESKNAQKQKEQSAKSNQEKLVIQNMINRFPDVKNPNSQLRKIAEKIYNADQNLQSWGYQGMYDACVQAHMILVEEGEIGPVKKPEIKNQLASGAVGGEIEPSSDVSDVEKIIEARNKAKFAMSDVFDTTKR